MVRQQEHRMRGRWMRGTRMRMHGGDNEDKDDGDDEEEGKS